MFVYKGEDVIDSHPTQLQRYLERGWSLEKPSPKKGSKPKKKAAQTSESEETQNEN